MTKGRKDSNQEPFLASTRQTRTALMAVCVTHLLISLSMLHSHMSGLDVADSSIRILTIGIDFPLMWSWGLSLGGLGYFGAAFFIATKSDEGECSEGRVLKLVQSDLERCSKLIMHHKIDYTPLDDLKKAESWVSDMKHERQEQREYLWRGLFGHEDDERITKFNIEENRKIYDEFIKLEVAIYNFDKAGNEELGKFVKLINLHTKEILNGKKALKNREEGYLNI